MMSHLQIIEIAGAACSFLGVWFLRKQSILYWPFNLVSSALCMYVFGQKGIYAQMSLQLIYIALCIYGIVTWLKHKKAGTVVEVVHFTQKVFIQILLTGATLTTILYFILSKFTNSDVVLLDSITTAFSLIGTYLFTKKYIETWLIWIVVDVLGIGLFIHTQLYSMAILYFIFIGTATQGYFLWKKSFKEKSAL